MQQTALGLETLRNGITRNRAHSKCIYIIEVQLTSALLIKAGKSVADHILRISAVQLLSKHGQKHGEVDRAWRFVHHCLQVVICGILTWEMVR